MVVFDFVDAVVDYGDGGGDGGCGDDVVVVALVDCCATEVGFAKMLRARQYFGLEKMMQLGLKSTDFGVLVDVVALGAADAAAV